VADNEMKLDAAQSESGGRPAGNNLPVLPADAIAIIPVREMTLFPGVVLPVTVGRQRSIAAAQSAVREQRQVGILMQRDGEQAEPQPIDLHRIGTVANVVRYVTAPDGTHHLVVQGDERFQAVEFLSGWPFLVARVQRVADPEDRSPEIEARFLNLQRQTVEALELLPQAPPEMIVAVQSVRSPGALADLAAAYLDLQPAEKQEILETIDVSARMDKVSKLLAHRIEVLRLSQEIGRQTKAALDERQREVLLREQMAAIQRQLGEGEQSKAQDIAELSEAIAKAQMPKEARSCGGWSACPRHRPTTA
jgi:ATP-dependent Lon protease